MYLSLLSHVDSVIENLSSSLYELPYLKKSTIDIKI